MPLGLHSQTTNPLLKRVQDKLNLVKNYRAEGTLYTDVSFIKIPESKISVLFKNPDKFKIRKQEGIAIVPKGGVSINLGSLIGGSNYTAVDAGQSIIGGQPVAVIKLLPLDENSDIVLSTLYIDQKDAVVRKAKTTTKTNGSYEIEFTYNKYRQWGLPDKVIFLFDAKDYKLPKGVTFEYETGEQGSSKPASGQGRIEIRYNSYTINKGISDKEFE
jgi:outer membrane lipoprotein-sorting protein